MENKSFLAERIKLQAKKKGINVKDILEYYKIDRNLINKLANGKDTGTQNILKIADYLDCSVDYLLGRTDNPNAHKVAAEQPKMSLALKIARSNDDRPMEIIEVDEEKLKNAPRKKL